MVLAEPAIHARGRIRPFELERPATVSAATKLLGGAGLPSRIMAGGIDVVNAMKFGLPVPRVVHLGAIPELRRIQLTDDELHLGATTRHADVIANAGVRAAQPDLVAIVEAIGNVRVRAVGTLGGNVMAGYRYYDWLPILMALDAQVVLSNSVGTRRIAARDLVSPAGEWTLPEGLLTEFVISRSGSPAIAFVRRLKPILSVAVCLRRRGARSEFSVAVGCMHEGPIVRTLPALDGDTGAAALDDLAAGLLEDLPAAHDDGWAPASYRRSMVGVLASRAMRDLLVRANAK